MADDKVQNGDGTPEDEQQSDGGAFESDDFGSLTDGGDTESGSDLGNLPPLSDFESSEAPLTDSNLPPLGSLDSDGDASSGGLPPISDIPVETPAPSGGYIKPPPPGFESDKPMDTPSGFDTPSSDGGFTTPTSDGGLDTPTGDTSFQGLNQSGGAFETPTSDSDLETPQRSEASFQDLAADSDFTPETPEIAPGPDSDLETPMFDSAFGTTSEGTGDFGGPVPDTSAPTQAMETPMFDEQPAASAGVGFDEGAFGDQGDMAMGTPAPDFSPDTPAPAPPPPGAIPEVQPTPVATKPPKSGSIVMTIVGMLVVFVIGSGIGLFVGPMLSQSVTMIPNPLRQVVADKEQEVTRLQSQLDRITDKGPTEPKLTPEQIEELIKQRDQLTAEIDKLTPQLTTLTAQVEEAKTELAGLEEEIEYQNEQYVLAQQDYEELVNQTSIVRARRDGLSAEVARLQDLVGGLEDADVRRTATKDTLVSNVEQLAIMVREGIPLTPEKYARDRRIADVEALKRRVQNAKWVAPELLEEYTRVYLSELGIAGARDYFYARIPTKDRFGTPADLWAECLMNGNWSVYYRTLDGKHIGSYMNTAQAGSPDYQFVENFSPTVLKQIEGEIVTARPKDWEQKVSMLVERQLMTQEKTRWQEVHDSM